MCTGVVSKDALTDDTLAALRQLLHRTHHTRTTHDGMMPKLMKLTTCLISFGIILIRPHYAHHQYGSIGVTINADCSTLHWNVLTHNTENIRARRSDFYVLTETKSKQEFWLTAQQLHRPAEHSTGFRQTSSWEEKKHAHLV